MKLISWGNSWQKRAIISPRILLARENERQTGKGEENVPGRTEKQGLGPGPSALWSGSCLQSFPFLGTTQTVVGAWLDIQNVSQLKAEVKDGTIITNKASLFTSPVSVFCRNQEADCHQREPAC